MALTKIADGKHVARHCRQRELFDGPDGLRPYPTIFELRAKIGETYISAVYCEYFAAEPLDQMRLCWQSLDFQVRPGEAMVKLSAQAIRAVGAKRSVPIRVVHNTSNMKNPAYAQIIGLGPAPNIQLNQDLVETAVVATIPVAALT